MDPYKVLGIPRDATDDEVKKAYRELARKYHPDNYNDNPLLGLAQEKMKEINEAYDLIMKERASGGNGYSGASGKYGSSGTSDYAVIRSLINERSFYQAEERLNAMSGRDAEWYYLMGKVYAARGWYDDARRYYQTAVNMQPSNLEYRGAMSGMDSAGRAYRTNGGGVGGMSTCDCCSSLVCADCCCECMGGDLIPCC